MFFLWAERLSNANSVTRLQRCSLPSRPSGKNMRRLHLGAASLWLRLTNTHTTSSSNVHFSAKHTRFICVMHTKHTQLHFCTTSPLSFSRTHTQAHAHTPFGCNKTADQSHWLLTGTDTETCCCWKPAWEMFITHKACRFGQERNNGLIKWRPGAAVGEIHTHPRAHPHVLRESLKPWHRPSALIGWEKLGLPEKCKTFLGTVEFAEVGLWRSWQTDKLWHKDMCNVKPPSRSTERGSQILLRRNVPASFSQEPADIDWSFWCLSGSLYNSHKKRFNILEHGWTWSLVSIVTLLSISLNIALLTDFSPAQIIKHSWRGGRCVDMDNNVPDSRQWNDLLACQNNQRLVVFTVQTVAKAPEEQKKTTWNKMKIGFYFTREHSSISSKREDLQGATCLRAPMRTLACFFFCHGVLITKPSFHLSPATFHQVCKILK